jgi:hypothetical protein
MGMDPQIFHKTHVTAHRPEPERETRLVHRGPTFETRNNLRTIVSSDPHGGPPPGSVDLRDIVYLPEATEDWGRGARLQDVIASIKASEADLCVAVGNQLVEQLDGLWGDAKVAFAARDQRLTALEVENSSLRAALAEARGQIAAVLELQDDFERRMRMRAMRSKVSRRKAPGATDGAAA